MNNRLVQKLAIIVTMMSVSVSMQAQESPVDHMNIFTKREELLSVRYMSYMSSIAHGGSAQKMEKRRVEVVNIVKQNIAEISRVKPYQGDATLRDAYKQYWTVLANILNEDYHKIVDMEEVAEQSYDAMEAYLLTQEKASEKLAASAGHVSDAYVEFAKKNNVRLIAGEDSKLQKKLAATTVVNGYFNDLYLLFFRSHVQEAALLKGLNEMDVNAFEQSKNTLAKYATEGLAKLDTTKAFRGDASLKVACKKILEFHRSEADRFTALTNFMIKKEEFEKYKKTFDAKPASRRTQGDIDSYNKLLADYNGSVKEYNKVNSDLNNNRSKTLDDWEKTRARFLDAHVPKA